MSWVRSFIFATALLLGWQGIAVAQVGCVPNPNLSGPPFVDGCRLPAAGLNNAFGNISTRSCANILNFGGIRNNTGDNVAAWNAAKATSNCIYFPAGTYRFAGPIAYTTTALLPSVTVFGDGQDVTVLTWPNSVTKAISLSLGSYQQSFHLRDFTMTTGTINTDTAIDVVLTNVPSLPFQNTFAPNDLTRITFRSSEGYWNQDFSTPIHNSWGTCFHSANVSAIDFVSVKIWGPTPDGVDKWPDHGGIGFSIEATHSGTGSNVFNFTAADVNWTNTGLVIGAMTQGYTINQSNFVGNRLGIFTGVAMSALAQLSITGSQFNNQHSILLNSRLPGTQISNSTFFVNGGGTALVHGDEVAGTMVTGNYFIGNLPDPAQTGDAIGFQPAVAYSDQDSAPPVVVGNIFTRLNSAIQLKTNMGPAMIHSNIFHKNNVNIINNTGTVQNQTTITGATRLGLPLYNTISGAVDNGSGFVRLTLSLPTDMITGMMVIVSGVTGVAFLDDAIVTPIRVIDSTHVDLTNISFSGSYGGGGRISTLP